MRRLSFNPDRWMRWIDDSTHPDSDTPRAEALRAARDRAILNAPAWMKRDAAIHDAEQEEEGQP